MGGKLKLVYETIMQDLDEKDFNKSATAGRTTKRIACNKHCKYTK
jgi:hypothetical protein